VNVFLKESCATHHVLVINVETILISKKKDKTQGGLSWKGIPMHSPINLKLLEANNLRNWLTKEAVIVKKLTALKSIANASTLESNARISVNAKTV